MDNSSILPYLVVLIVAVAVMHSKVRLPTSSNRDTHTNIINHYTNIGPSFGECKQPVTL